MKKILIPLLLVAVALVWWLWPNPIDRAAPGHSEVRREAAESTRTVVPIVDPEVERREQSGAACLQGVVSGPDGTIWNARVRIHRAGDEVAFDETGTAVDGKYKLEFAVGEEGEDFDVHFVPPKDVPLGSKILEDLHLAPGGIVRRDVNFEAGEVLAGRVRGIRNQRAIPLVAIDFGDWERVRAAAAEGYPAWSVLGRLSKSRVRASPEFRFTQLATGTYALVSARWDYVVLDPQPVSPGDESVIVRVTRITDVSVGGRDAATDELVSNIRIAVEGASAPFHEARGSGSFRARLRWDGYGAHRARTVRISAPGYYPQVHTHAPHEQFHFSFRQGLVARDSKRITLVAKGDGAARFIREIQISLWRRRGETGQVFASPAALARKDDRLAFPIPAGRWNAALYFHATSFQLPHDVELDGSADRELRFAAEPWATLELDARGIEYPRHTSIRAEGPLLVWKPGADGVYRLAAVPNRKGRFELLRTSLADRAIPATVTLPPGTWTVHWAVHGSKGWAPHKQTLTLAPGDRVPIALNR